MFCESCGREVKDDDVFCPNCGRPIQTEQTSNNLDKTIENKKNVHEPKKRKSKKILLIIGIILGVIAFILFAANSQAKDTLKKLQKYTTVSKVKDGYEFVSDNSWTLCYTKDSETVRIENSDIKGTLEFLLGLEDLGRNGDVYYNLDSEEMHINCETPYGDRKLTSVVYDTKEDSFRFMLDLEWYEPTGTVAELFEEYELGEIFQSKIVSLMDDLKKMDLTKDDVANLTYKDIKANVDDKELKISDQEELKPQSKDETVQKENTESSIDKSLSWKKAYLDYLNKIGNTEYGYSLEYIDGDDVPELVIDYKNAAKGVSLCTYDGSKVVETPVGEFLRYKLKENSFCVSGGRMDYYYDIIYKIVDGVPQEVAKGEYGILDQDNKKYDEAGDIIYQYLWNGKSVSEYDYSDFTQPFNFEDNTDVVCSAGSGYFYDIIKVLEHPLDIVTISPYLNDNGYESLLNNCKVLFDGIEGDKIHFSVTYEGELVGSASATIIDSKTAEYKNAKCELKIKFYEDCKKLEIEGHMDTIDLTGSYTGAWG